MGFGSSQTCQETHQPKHKTTKSPAENRSPGGANNGTAGRWCSLEASPQHMSQSTTVVQTEMPFRAEKKNDAVLLAQPVNVVQDVVERRF